MEQNLKKRLGKRIQELRLKNGLKQATLAEKVNLAHKSQSCIETGKNYPSAEVVEKYANALNVDVSEILDIEHIKPTKELIEEMNLLLNNADERDVVIAYRVLKSIFR